jgi:Domain of unknown function (DUF4386)
MTSIALRPGELSSPRTIARYAGAIYLLIIVGGIFAQIGVRAKLLVAGDAAATAHNIATHELLYRLGFSVEVFYLLWGIPLKLFLYELFKVVHRRAAIVMILFAAVGSAIQGACLLAHYAPLMILDGRGAGLDAFTPAQRAAAAYFSLRLFDYGYNIALSFFGGFCLILGTLILRQRFFPRFVGALLVLEGALYLTNSFAHFIAPAVGDRVFPFLALSGLGEISFCLSLLIAGVNVERWREQARRGDAV